jgi:hypothetical protein
MPVQPCLISVSRLGGAVLLGMAALPAHAEAPVIIEHVTGTYDVQENGGYTNTISMVIKVTSEATAAGMGQFPISYSPSWQPVDQISAHLEKADGTSLPVTADSIRDQPAPGDASLQMFSDIRQKVLVFPPIAAGDKLVLSWRLTMAKPRVPGGFLANFLVARQFALNDSSITIRLPPGQSLQVDAVGYEKSSSVENGQTTYRLHASFPTELTNDVAAMGPFSRWPHVMATTFKDWDGFAAGYASILMPHAAVTPKIQTLADDITAGMTDRRAQAAALYDWTRKRVRYVNVQLANGGLDPHDADDIAKNGFGDCKDHAVILHALLAAKGIAAEMVAINLGNEAVISTVPSIAPMNHMISYIPEFDLYVDSTNPTAPFGDLSWAETGKSVVHIGGEGPVLRRTKIPPAAANTADHATDATLATDGTISGTSTTTARGAWAVSLRGAAQGFASRGKEAAATALLKQLGLGGTGSLDFASPLDATEDYRVSGSFKLEKDASLLDGQSFTLWTGLRSLARPGDTLLGPIFLRNLPDTEATFCFPGSQSETLSLVIPDGREIDKLPKDLSIDNDMLRYSAHWSMDGQKITVRRALLSKIAGPVCAGEVRKALAPSMIKIRDDYNRRVELKQ